MERPQYRVLVVDDNEAMRDLIVNVLSGAGHQCIAAIDGNDALAKANENNVGAVITDIVMPGMDGITLTKELSKEYDNLPIMILTGHGDRYSPETVITAGAREFIKKPFPINEFIIRFDKMMREHKEQEASLALSLTDELTGLCNRRRFFVLAEQSLKVAIRTKKRLLVLYIDMDDLKWINDHCGHNEGDRALIDLANILKKTFRESDIIARIGGDEFVVLLESTDENDKILITRLYENIEHYNAKGSRRYLLSISVGATQFDPDNPISIGELLSKVDALMYVQKRRRWKKQSHF